VRWITNSTAASTTGSWSCSRGLADDSFHGEDHLREDLALLEAWEHPSHCARRTSALEARAAAARRPGRAVARRSAHALQAKHRSV